MAVRIDLRRDLPKALAMKDQLFATVGICDYTAPCVIGAMVPEGKRALLDCANSEDMAIQRLLKDGDVKAPKHQWDELIGLQRAFDCGLAGNLAEQLELLRRKYLPASCDTHPKDGDAVAAPLVSGAVPEGQTPNTSQGQNP